MKTRRTHLLLRELSAILLAVLLLSSLRLSAGAALRAAEIVERGPHYRKLAHVTSTTTSDGKTVLRTNRYTELANGICYQNQNGEWLDSKEVIDIVPGGALASQGAHQVGFAANINTRGAINMFTPDGKRLRSHVLGLAYTDAKTGKSILIAEVRDSIGELVGQNQVIYREAFAELRADVRYTYTLAGLEQDIILRDNPPSPDAYGLNPATTRLEVFTEFIEAPSPEIVPTTLSALADPIERATMLLPDFVDQTLKFGVMEIGSGQAFPLSDENNLFEGTVRTGKTWEQKDGRTFLIEAVEYPAIKPHLDALAAKAAANQQAKARAVRTFPSAPAQAKKTETMRMAAVRPKEDGFVIDYIVASGVTNFTFAADTTYYVGTGVFSLWGTTVIEGGTVIKFTNGVSTPQLRFANGIDCRTSPYRPAIATSLHDDTVGDTIAASTGNPTNYCGIMIFLGNGTAGNFSLHDLHVWHAYRAFYGTTFVNADISNCQIRHTTHAFNNEQAVWNLRNILVSDAVNGFSGTAPHTNNAEHVTFFAVNNFRSGSSISAVNLTNSLLISVTNLVSWVGTGVQTNLSGTGVFQTVGSGAHYLSASSLYRDAGTTNINADLLTSLRQRTTYPPQWLSTTIGADKTLGPVVARDTGAPDLGYHYDVLDYFVSGLILTNATVVLADGVSVGVDYSAGSWGFIFKNSKLVSQGSALNPNRIVRAHMVQERSSGNPGTRALFYDGASATASNELRLRFTEFGQSANDGYMLYTGTKFRAVEFSHSAIYNPSLVVDTAGGNYLTCGLTNTLWERGGSQFGLTSSSTNSTVHARNNLFRKFSQHFVGAKSSWTVSDNLVDTGGLYDQGVAVTNANNAYYLAITNLSGGTSNLTLTNLTYVTGPLGNYYLPTNSVLLDRGSVTADQVALYHFTSTTNHVKEGNSAVNIGVHYAALTNSLAGGFIAIDTDRDGWADYVEDRDGDGDPTGDPTDFQMRSTDGVNPDFVVADHEPPFIYITSPMNPVTARTRIHLDGYCEERLRTLTYTIYTNGAVSWSGRGGITNQTWNMDIRYFTTNFFRCYDLPLAVGLNTIVLIATDLNGKVASNTVSYTVDFSSDTSAPVLTPQWPTNGVAVSGTNFTMSGTINNPSAGIVVIVSSASGTNTFYGIASTDGQYWVPDVTLFAGTNTVTIISTSPGGQSTTNTMTVVKSTLEVTIDTGISVTAAFDLDLAGDVTGTINGTAGYSVSCNGVAAGTTTSGGVTYWTAEDVPGNENGWMELVATVTPTGGGAPITAKYEWEKPPLLRLKTYHLDDSFLGTWTEPTNGFWFNSVRRDYTRRAGGSYTGTLLDDSGCTVTYAWTANDVPIDYLKTCPDSPPDPNGTGEPVPDFDGSIELTDFTAGQVDGPITWTFHRQMDQQVELRAGGKPYPGRLDLVKFHVSANANNYSFTHEAPPYESYNAGAISNNLITVLGEIANADGAVYPQVIPSSIQDVTPAAPGASKQISVSDPIQTKLQIIFRGTDVAVGGKTSVVWVGEKIDLTAQLSTNIGPLTNIQWMVPGNRVKDFGPTDATFTNGYSLPLTNTDLMTNRIVFYWLDGGLVDVTCTAIALGKTHTAHALIDVRRPSASLVATVSGAIASDTNWPLGLALHFGNGLQVTNFGITFKVPDASIDLKGYPSTNLSVLWFRFFQMGSSSLQYNHTDGTSCVTQSGSGLDNASSSTYFYPRFFTLETNGVGQISTNMITADSPGTRWESFMTKMWRGNSLSTYLMFLPSGGIPVPIKKVDWNWSAIGTPTNVISAVYPSNLSANDVFALPSWSNHITNRTSVTNSPWCQ